MLNIFIRASSVLCIIFIKVLVARTIIDNYNNNRTSLLDMEYEDSLGGRLPLSGKEIAANEILMRWKLLEINITSEDPEYFSFSKPFYTYKDKIEKSKVFQIIRRMPKGATLHVHNSLMLDPDYLMTLTYEDNLYACLNGSDFEFQFSEVEPQRTCKSKWTLLSDIRKNHNNVQKFDSELRKRFTLYSGEESSEDLDINTAWERFNKVHHATKSLIVYRPVREKFFYESLKRMYEDNVMYAEIRSGLGSLHELNGTRHEKLYLAKLFKRITENFIKEHPDFMGIKLIVTCGRRTSMEKVSENIDLARRVKNELPEMFAGFDLVGQEDLGQPLVDFVPVLLEAKNDMNFFFHGGETDWYGSSSDENLVDAVLLGSKRIGHGYALIKHPHLMNAVKQGGIAVEVNVISNVVLSLVSDVRNHPLAAYLANNLPVVLSSDDPGAWEAYPASHDFYVAFMGVASIHSDLRMLKQLAINSIKYSALDEHEKKTMFSTFFNRWDGFIDDVITNFIP